MGKKENNVYLNMYYVYTLICTMYMYYVSACFPFFYSRTRKSGGTRWRSWLRHCATSRRVAGSIPDDVIGIFH